ncbi:hypothetical protein DL765_003477 [Monosporascus sp. GIB2]|nr:hypothetical protein DL765_003477 [Monosporascus sp. GIB2]
MRIPYTPSPPQPTNAEDAAIVGRIQQRRAPRPLQPLDLALLHAPPVADGWNAFLGSVRQRTTLDPGLRELLICRVAVCNGAWYEWAHHAPLALAAGVGEEAMGPGGVVRREGPLGGGAAEEDEEEWRTVGLSEKMWAALRVADEMTRNVSVRDETFDALRRCCSEREVVEVVATVGPLLSLLLREATASGRRGPKRSDADWLDAYLRSRLITASVDFWSRWTLVRGTVPALTTLYRIEYESSSSVGVDGI